MFRLESPGGGGYGRLDDQSGSSPPKKKAKGGEFHPSGSVEGYKQMQESA